MVLEYKVSISTERATNKMFCLWGGFVSSLNILDINNSSDVSNTDIFSHLEDYFSY